MSIAISFRILLHRSDLFVFLNESSSFQLRCSLQSIGNSGGFFLHFAFRHVFDHLRWDILQMLAFELLNQIDQGRKIIQTTNREEERINRRG